MTILVKSVKIVDSKSLFNGKVVDLLINNNKIEKIAENISDQTDEKVDAKGLSVSPGWIDSLAFIGEPGYEHQETIQSGLNAAKRGGFTGVALMPNTSPCVQSKSEVTFLKSKAGASIVDIFPLGAISQNLEGKELTEMYDMHDAGAVAFTDGKRSINQTDLMLRALLYVKRIDATIFNFPEDKYLAEGGQMNEGEASARLGMKGVPHIAEEIMVNRDLKLAAYCDSKIHFSKISSGGSVALIKEAKAKGVKVSSAVPSYQLLLNDDEVKSYDSNYKVSPVLRTNSDIDQLKAGLADGTIEVICSNHIPKEEEAKKKEYNLADAGIINFETCFSSAIEALNSVMSMEAIIDKLTYGPRSILGLDSISIKEGDEANLTIFSEDESWTFDQSKSISKNSPFFGKTFKGKAKYLVNKGQINQL
jgi:dihydroorotase